MPKTLKGKISWIYMGLVCLIALVGIVSVLNLVDLQKGIGGLLADNYRSISAMSEANSALSQQNVAILQYLELDDPLAVSRYYAADKTASQAIWKEESNVTEPGEKKIADALGNDFALWRQKFSVFQNLRDIQGQAAAAAYYQSDLQPLYERVTGEAGRILSINQSAMLQKRDSTAARTRQSLLFILILSVLAVVGGFILARCLIGRFLGPLRILTDSIGKVRAGERHKPVDIHTGDEMEQLARAFNGMIERISAFETSTMGTLMEEKNRSVSIVKSISDPLLVLDVDFRIVMANGACERFFGFDERKMLGRHFLEAIRDGELFDFVLACVTKGDPASQKVWRFSREKTYYFNLILTRVQSGGPKGPGCILLMQNVTDFKELERIKTDFVATVSHEFKTPLTSIIMGASMLQGGRLGTLSGEQAEVVHTIIEDGEKLSAFVSELLEVSRLESGKAVYSFAPCSLSAVAERSVQQFAAAAAEKHVTIENDVDESLPLIYADFERITWVMNNLLGNAVKYTKAGDFITIRAKVQKKWMEVSVKDTGDGIPSEYLPRIFDKFVQVNGRDIEVRGSGLGLAVAKEIITAHQGRIWARSEQDAGSTFTFTLPLFEPTRGANKT